MSGGIRGIFKSAAKTITTAFGNVPLTVTYSRSTTTYNATTNTEDTTTTNYPNLKMFFMEVVEEQTGKAVSSFKDVKPTDVIGSIPVDNLNLIPYNTDIVTVTSPATETAYYNKTFKVLDYNTDPAEAMYQIHLRPD